MKPIIMKTKFQIYLLVILNALATMNLSCAKDDGGSKVKPNPFENDGTKGSFIKVSYSSNADSVFFKWELQKTLDFDTYQVSSDKLTEKVSVGRDKVSCILTHFPYSEAVPVTIAALKNNQVVDTVKFFVTIDGLDTVFAQKLIPDYGSVTGGDGMYSIALPDGRSIFLMGDSYTGTVTNGARSMQDHMFRNSYIMYDKGNVSAIVGANGPKTSGAVPLGVTDEGKKWYWPGHGFVAGNKLYVFQTLMYQGAAGMWGFMYEKTDILEYNLPGMELQQTVSVPFKGSTDIHYGMAALNDDDYIYIYAQVDVQNSIPAISDASVARTTVSNLYTKWEYFNGSGWSENSADAVKMSGLAGVAVSSQFNVFKLNGKYVLLTQEKTYNAGKIYTFIADNPQGPWYNKKLIYTTKEQAKPGLLTYNAMAHPQFNRNGMMLVSYNVNTENFEQQHNDVSTYRPRFFWVEINKVLNN
jgi:hypothetical protein